MELVKPSNTERGNETLLLLASDREEDSEASDLDKKSTYWTKRLMAKARRTKDPSKRQTSNGKKNSTDKKKAVQKKYDGVVAGIPFCTTAKPRLGTKSEGIRRHSFP